MKTETTESISFEFCRDCPEDTWILFAQFDGAVYICLVPFKLKMDAKSYIVEAIDHFTGMAYLEGEWELVWSDSPTFIQAQARMSFEKVVDAANDHLPM